MVGENMEYILGLLTGVVFFSLLGVALYIGYRLGKKKPKVTPVDEEEQRRTKQFDDHFKALFNYDVQTALQRKKVTNE